MIVELARVEEVVATRTLCGCDCGCSGLIAEATPKLVKVDPAEPVDVMTTALIRAAADSPSTPPDSRFGSVIAGSWNVIMEVPIWVTMDPAIFVLATIKLTLMVCGDGALPKLPIPWAALGSGPSA